jgi:phospholipid/cholesterol/gamma-HCH transport system permease protein
MSSATTRGVDRIAQAGTGALSQTGNIVQLFVDVARQTFVRPFQWREFIQQAWFIASVTILPTALIAIPFGATAACPLP